MRCPECQHADFKVIDSRSTSDAIRRRRECLNCGTRFTTYERVERQALWVLKKSGAKEPFSREKVLAGLSLACRKRPVSAEAMDAAVDEVEAILRRRRELPVPASSVGEAVMEVLRSIDAVAYVRFASVYREFESVEQFVHEIEPLQEQR